MQPWKTEVVCAGRYRPRQFEYHPTFEDVVVFGTLRGEHCRTARDNEIEILGENKARASCSPTVSCSWHCCRFPLPAAVAVGSNYRDVWCIFDFKFDCTGSGNSREHVELIYVLKGLIPRPLLSKASQQPSLVGACLSVIWHAHPSKRWCVHSFLFRFRRGSRRGRGEQQGLLVDSLWPFER